MIGKALIKLSGRLIKKGKPMTAAQKAALKKAIQASAKARTKNVISPVISPRRARKLAVLNQKITLNKNALKKLSKGTKTVYRIENIKGEGPLMGKNLKHYAAMPLNIKRGYKVAPVSDYNRTRAAMLKALAPKGTPFEEIKFNRGDKFAFKSVSQANKYFSKQEQAFLKTRGFELKAIKNATVVGQSSTQVSYNISSDIQRLQKETTRLVNKYKKLTLEAYKKSYEK